MKYLAWLSVGLAVFALLFHFLFFFDTAVVDTTFYWAIGSYFMSGKYPFSYPFIYVRPTTISPPLYGLLLMLFDKLPMPDILIHAFQLLALAATGWLVYKTVRLYFSEYAAMLAGSVTVLIPGNFVFASQLLTENGAEFLVVLYAYLLFAYFRKKRLSYLYVSALIGFVSTLFKYSFLIYGGISLLIILWKHPKLSAGYLLPSAGIITVGLWVIINYQITGIWGLNDAKGVNLYNQIVWTGRTLPDDTSVSLRELKSYVPPGTDLHSGYWDYQRFILSQFHNEWKAVERVLGGVARDAVRQHPVRYLMTGIMSGLKEHFDERPYWSNLDDFGKKSGDPYPPSCKPVGTIKLCEPIIRLPGYFSVWNGFVAASTLFYTRILPYISVLIILPLFLMALIYGGFFGRALVFLHVMSVLSVTLNVHLDSRYIVPFYPLIVMACTVGMEKFRTLLKKFFRTRAEPCSG